jgi:hypothetical protein
MQQNKRTHLLFSKALPSVVSQSASPRTEEQNQTPVNRQPNCAAAR